MMHTATVFVAAAGWQILLTVGALVGVIVAAVALQIWSQRRRRRGEEATSSEAEGAEGFLRFPGLP